MPTYSFRCLECGGQCEVIRLMKDSDKLQLCICGADMIRDFQADLPHAAKDYNKPLHSDSLAISPTQRAEHERLFPDVKLDEACRPVFDNFRQHDNYLKKTGFIKHSQKTKPKGKRIA